jgi:hypothetical protein
VWILRDKLCLKKFRLRWVPHALSINKKSERVSDSKVLLKALMEQKASGLQRIITGNESHFFLAYPPDSVWAASHDELPQHIKQKIDMGKCLVLILWSVNGIHSLLNVPKGTTYNTAFFFNAVLPGWIETVRSQTRRKTLKGWLATWTVRILTIRGTQRCIEGSSADACRIRLPAQTWPRVIASSLDISKENYAMTNARTGRTS